MSLSEVYFYSRRRMTDTIADAVTTKPGDNRKIYLYTRPLTPLELQKLFPSLETHAHECVLLVDCSKGETINENPYPKISFNPRDVDKTIMRANVVFFSPQHKKLHYDKKRQRKQQK